MQGAPRGQLSHCARPGIVRVCGHAGGAASSPTCPFTQGGTTVSSAPLAPGWFEQSWVVLHATMAKLDSAFRTVLEQAGDEMRDAEHRGMGAGSLSLVGVRNQHKQGICLSMNKLGVTAPERNRGGEEMAGRSDGICPAMGLLGRTEGHRGHAGQTGVAEAGWRSCWQECVSGLVQRRNWGPRAGCEPSSHLEAQCPVQTNLYPSHQPKALHDATHQRYHVTHCHCGDVTSGSC